MQSHAATRQVNVDVGSIFQIALDDVDRAKVDDHNLTCIVVELVAQLRQASAVVNTSATPSLMGLQSVLDGWRELPQAKTTIDSNQYRINRTQACFTA